MKWHRKFLRWLLPPCLLNRLNALSHLEDRLYELEHRCARLAAIALRAEYGNLFAEELGREFGIFSEHGEDGMLLWVLEQTGAPVKRFAEIGVEHGRECNTAILGFVLGWDGLMLEADPVRAAAAERLVRQMLKGRPNRIEVRRVRVTPDNVNDLLGAGELAVLSIDVDGMDYWLWKAVHSVRPRVVVIEYNASFGREAAITVPFQPDFNPAAAHPSGYYHGASLAALEKLAREKGYDLVAVCSAGVNAFFVRQDIRPAGLHAARAAEIYRPHAARCRKHSPEEQWDLIRHLPYERV
ncbi:MAG: hypothetical protein RMK57_03080 [Bryobacterales bacterium]|nr:hypothetical protein [Bryobacterales bacterium]